MPPVENQFEHGDIIISGHGGTFALVLKNIFTDTYQAFRKQYPNIDPAHHTVAIDLSNGHYLCYSRTDYLYKIGRFDSTGGFHAATPTPQERTA